MTPTIKILTVLFLVFITACNNKQLPKNQSSSISYENGIVIIDTNTILTNKNLEFFINDLTKQELEQKMTYQEIPNFIKVFLDSLTDNFSIANVGEVWRVGCTEPFEIDSTTKTTNINKKTGDTIYQFKFKTKEYPSRQLNYFGLGKDLALMKYYSGGIAKIEHILIFKFKNEILIDFWSGTGSIFKDNVTKEDIIKYLKENKNKDWGLNTNMIYL